MFTEENVICDPPGPQFGGSSIIITGVFVVLLVTVMIRWSPGFTCSVGFSRPLGVMKQNRVLPAASVVVWYENWTDSRPF